MIKNASYGHFVSRLSRHTQKGAAPHEATCHRKSQNWSPSVPQYLYPFKILRYSASGSPLSKKVKLRLSGNRFIIIFLIQTGNLLVQIFKQTQLGQTGRAREPHLLSSQRLDRFAKRYWGTIYLRRIRSNVKPLYDDPNIRYSSFC